MKTIRYSKWPDVFERDFQIQKEIVPVSLPYRVPSAGAQKQPDTHKAWVPHLKKNNGDFFFPSGNKTQCNMRREQRLLFFLNDSPGSWNWAQQIERVRIDFRRYVNVTQTFLKKEPHQTRQQFSLFLQTNIRQPEKKKPYSWLSLPWLTVRNKRLGSNGRRGQGRANLSVLVTSHLPLIPSLGGCLSQLLSLFL